MMKQLILSLAFSASAIVFAQAQTEPNTGINPEPMAGDTLLALFQNINQIDFIFNAFPVTTNAEGKNAQMCVQLFSAQAPATQNCAKALATVIFTDNSKGRMVMEGTVYFAQGCTYWTIAYKGKKYANAMSTQGVNYFNQIIQAVQKQNNAANSGTSSGH